jgi:hypothetical protein
VREYLATLDEAAWGAATDGEPKFVSPSDPAAQWTGALRGPAFFAYADNDLIDLKAAVIVDVEASRAVRQAEVGAARTMLERTAERFGLKPERLAGDSAYGSAEMLFTYLKRILKMGRLRPRSPCRAQDEFLLAAPAQNLRKLAQLILPTEPQMAQGA